MRVSPKVFEMKNKQAVENLDFELKISFSNWKMNIFSFSTVRYLLAFLIDKSRMSAFHISAETGCEARQIYHHWFDSPHIFTLIIQFFGSEINHKLHTWEFLLYKILNSKMEFEYWKRGKFYLMKLYSTSLNFDGLRLPLRICFFRIWNDWSS